MAGPERLPASAAPGRALAGAGLGAAAGLITARAMGADPVPDSGVLGAVAVGVGLLAGGLAVMIARTVMSEAGGCCARPRPRRTVRALRDAPRLGAGAPTDRRCTVAEPSPLHGRSIVEVLATSAGGVGTHVRTIVPAVRAAGRHRPGLRRAGHRGAVRLHRRRRGLRPVGISGHPPVADGRAVLELRRAAPGPTWSTPTACAPAWWLRSPAGCRASAAARPHPRAVEDSGPRQRLLRAVEVHDPRG